MADEALGRDGGPRHAGRGRSRRGRQTWPRIVEDAARGELKDVYAPVDAAGQGTQALAQAVSCNSLDTIDLKQFNLVPKSAKTLAAEDRRGLGTFRIVPVESGRGCPYVCEFCTVTGSSATPSAFRTNESVVNELLLLKARARKERGQIAVSLSTNNFAHQH